MIFTLAFWQGAGERLLKTFLQTFVAALTAAIPAGAVNAFSLDWKTLLIGALGIALLAAFYSLATSVGNAQFVTGDPASSDPAPVDPPVVVDVPDDSDDVQDSPLLAEPTSEDQVDLGS